MYVQVVPYEVESSTTKKGLGAAFTIVHPEPRTSKSTQVFHCLFGHVCKFGLDVRAACTFQNFCYICVGEFVLKGDRKIRRRGYIHMVFPQSLEAVKERFFVNAFFVILLDEEKGSLRLTRGGGRQFFIYRVNYGRGGKHENIPKET